MTWIIFISFQLFVTYILLKISGEIGKFSIPLGYMSLTRAYNSKNLSFNLFFRIFYIPVALSVLVVLLYILGLDSLIKNIWYVSIWYFMLHFCFLWNKITHIKFKLYLYSALGSIFLSFIFYQYALIKGIDYILPDAANFRTELWFVIILFFYNMLTNRVLEEDNDDLGDNLRDVYLKLKTKYKSVIRDEFLKNKILNDLLFSIMIYEDLNRPPWFRFIERTFYRFGFISTTGIMQVRSNKKLSNEESISLAQEIVLEQFNQNSYLLQMGGGEIDLVGKILTAYNPDAYYRNEVRFMYYRIQSVSTFFEENKFTEAIPSFVENISVENINNEIARLTKEIVYLEDQINIKN